MKTTICITVPDPDFTAYVGHSWNNCSLFIWRKWPAKILHVLIMITTKIFSLLSIETIIIKES